MLPIENKVNELADEIKSLIESAKQRVAVKVNAELSLLYWHVGGRINDELLKGDRAEYGKQVIADLSQQLTVKYGKGWSKTNLTLMIRFANFFPDLNIVQTLSEQLSWSHFVQLLAIEKPVKREFYISLAQQERWSTRTMAQRIESQLFERTLISKKPEDTIFLELKKLRDEGLYNQEMLLKDPYLLDFLELNDHYLEKDLEDAILREIEKFLLELGAGFTFVERQKRITVDDDDFYMDLLFFNRNLRRLILVELKLGHFKPEYKGQMEFYLRWLDRHERREGEEAPLGIILCSEKKAERVELLALDKSSIHVAEYVTGLPTKDEFSDKLQQIAQRAAARLQTPTHFNFNQCNIGLQGQLNELAQYLSENGNKEQAAQLTNTAKALEQVEDCKSEAELNKKGVGKRLERLMDDLGDKDSQLRKSVEGIKHGVGIAQDIGKSYNKIAEWAMLPQVPKAFLKK